jgi:hypothetical protein
MIKIFDLKLTSRIRDMMIRGPEKTTEMKTP